MNIQIDKIKGPLSHKHKAGDGYEYWKIKKPGVTTYNYAYLYNYFAISDLRHISADNWTVPVHEDWVGLAIPDGFDYLGGHLKEIGSTHWNEPNTGATNLSGFGARAGGTRYNGLFDGLKNYAVYWGSDLNAYYGYYLSFDNDKLTLSATISKQMGKSVRLVRYNSPLLDGETGTYTGNDGKIYSTVCIGTTEWTEAISETMYRDNSLISKITDTEVWKISTIGAYCAYDNIEANALVTTEIETFVYSHDTVIFPASPVITSTDGSVKIEGFDLSVNRPELELFADNETQLLAAWVIALASAKAARIYITNNITFTADRQFLQAYNSPGIKIEAIQNRYFFAGNYTIDFNNVTLTNIAFSTTGPYYLRLPGGFATFQNCGWIDDVIDTDARKINILVVDPITAGTGKIIIKTLTHFTQSAPDNTATLIQPFWIKNDATFGPSDGARQYVEILEMSAVFESSRFARVLLTSTQANCPYSVTGDESWFYSPDQALPGASNIKATANILRTTTVDYLKAARLPANETAPYLIGMDISGNAAKITRNKTYSGFVSQVGTDAPTISILQDSLYDVVLARTAAGTYTFTLIGAFTAGKTIPNKEEQYTDAAGNLFKMIWTSADVMTLLTYAAANTSVLADGVLVNQFINIEIYA